MDLIQKIKEQGNQASILLNDLLQTKIAFEVPNEDWYDFINATKYIFNWDFNSFEDIKALFENFDILQSIAIHSSDIERLYNYALSYTYTEERGTHTMIEKIFTKLDLKGVGSGDDYEPAAVERSVSITVFVDNNGKIDIEKTLNEGSVKGSISVVKGTVN